MTHGIDYVVPKDFTEPGKALLGCRAVELREVAVHVHRRFLHEVGGADLRSQFSRQFAGGQLQQVAAGRLEDLADGVGPAAAGGIEQFADVGACVHDLTGRRSACRAGWRGAIPRESTVLPESPEPG
jgi:hypothetical protein